MIGVLKGESVSFSQLGLLSELDREVEDEDAVVDDDDAIVAAVEEDGGVVVVVEDDTEDRSSGKTFGFGINFL